MKMNPVMCSNQSVLTVNSDPTEGEDSTSSFAIEDFLGKKVLVSLPDDKNYNDDEDDVDALLEDINNKSCKENMLEMKNDSSQSLSHKKSLDSPKQKTIVSSSSSSSSSSSAPRSVRFAENIESRVDENVDVYITEQESENSWYTEGESQAMQGRIAKIVTHYQQVDEQYTDRYLNVLYLCAQACDHLELPDTSKLISHSNARGLEHAIFQDSHSKRRKRHILSLLQVQQRLREKEDISEDMKQSLLRTKSASFSRQSRVVAQVLGEGDEFIAEQIYTFDYLQSQITKWDSSSSLAESPYENDD